MLLLLRVAFLYMSNPSSSDTDVWCAVLPCVFLYSQGQGIFSASRCLWDEKTDNYVSASYYNNSMFAVATVFACYYE